MRRCRAALVLEDEEAAVLVGHDDEAARGEDAERELRSKTRMPEA